jgi:hypothetical protein
MAYTILQNKKNLSVVIHADANTTLTIAGNNSTSNVAIDNEILTGAAIKQVWWGAETGFWKIKRGSNTIGVYDSTGWVDYAGNGIMINKDAGETLVLELNGTANGYVMVELQKIGTFTSTY